MGTVQEMVAEAKARIREISPEEARRLQARGVPVVDVREPAEFAEGHLPGAVNIPRGVLEFEVDGHPAVNCTKDPALGHREQPVILNCRSGARSGRAVDMLRAAGFRKVTNMTGGILRWSDEVDPSVPRY